MTRRKWYINEKYDKIAHVINELNILEEGGYIIFSIQKTENPHFNRGVYSIIYHREEEIEKIIP